MKPMEGSGKLGKAPCGGYLDPAIPRQGLDYRGLYGLWLRSILALRERGRGVFHRAISIKAPGKDSLLGSPEGKKGFRIIKLDLKG